MINPMLLLGSKKQFVVNEISTNMEGHYSLLFGQAQYNPTVYNQNNYSVFGTMDNKENNYETTMYLYNHLTKSYVSASWGSYPLNDYHSTPNTIFLPDGRILSFIDSNHNDVIDVKRSIDAYDILSHETTTTITGGNPAYATPVLIGSRIYVFARGEFNRNFVCWSDNYGDTFSTPIQVVELTGTNDWAYPRYIFSETKFKICVNQRNFPSNNYTNLYYLETLDGETWTNQDGSYSKNISIDGKVTGAQMDANFLLANSGFVSAIVEKNDNEIIYLSQRSIWISNAGVLTEKPLTSPNYFLLGFGAKSSFLKVNETTYYLVTLARKEDGGLNTPILIFTQNTFDTIKIFDISDKTNTETYCAAGNFAQTQKTIITALDKKIYDSGPPEDPDNSYSDFILIENPI